MNRIAYVMTARRGSEAELRQAQTNMPAGELEQVGIHGIESFIGSGYYILVLECEAGDMQATFRRFFELPGVQGFLDKLRPHVEGLPARQAAYAGGGSMSNQRGVGQQTVSSADLPLAASAFYWDAEHGLQNTGLMGRGVTGNGGGRRATNPGRPR